MSCFNLKTVGCKWQTCMAELWSSISLGAESAHNKVAGVDEVHPAPVRLGSGKVAHELAVHVSTLSLLAVVAHEGDYCISCCFSHRRNACCHVLQSHGQEVLIDLQPHGTRVAKHKHYSTHARWARAWHLLLHNKLSICRTQALRKGCAGIMSACVGNTRCFCSIRRIG